MISVRDCWLAIHMSIERYWAVRYNRLVVLRWIAWHNLKILVDMTETLSSVHLNYFQTLGSKVLLVEMLFPLSFMSCHVPNMTINCDLNKNGPGYSTNIEGLFVLQKICSTWQVCMRIFSGSTRQNSRLKLWEIILHKATRGCVTCVRIQITVLDSNALRMSQQSTNLLSSLKGNSNNFYSAGRTALQ